MIREIRIQNYKSVHKLKLDLGRITVLIGENGGGKSNILEAIALSAASANIKLNNEFLASRGIRVTKPQFMRALFDKENVAKEIKISLNGYNKDRIEIDFVLKNDNKAYSEWVDEKPKGISGDDESLIKYRKSEKLNLHKFLIYSPENVSLRTFEKEGQIQPLGIHGEGLFKLLRVLSDENKEKTEAIKKRLQLTDWFEDFEVPQNLFEGERLIRIRDKYLDEDIACFDQKSSNEGFLFLLFYFTLFISDDTPKFFAVDNIDESLNPKLCARLVSDLAGLSVKYDKQAIFTTHNPAVLDGLNLNDDEQRLFVVYRNRLGHTKARRISKPKPLEGQKPVKMSEAFLRGYIGGLPKNF